MSNMRDAMSEIEQWAMAAAMLETHGSNVGNALLQCVQSALASDDGHEVQNWLAISVKVHKLYAPNGDS